MDMWGLGCILAELRLGNPIFLGETNHDQLLAIVECLGDMEKPFSMAIPPDISNLILHRYIISILPRVEPFYNPHHSFI